MGAGSVHDRAARDLSERPALRANVRRNARAEPDRPRRWRPARDALWNHVQPYLPVGARVAILGAGNADDLPLTRLAGRAAHVTLFDLDRHAARAARRREAMRLRRRIEAVELDATDGAADAIARAAAAGPAFPTLADRAAAPLPGAPYDLVIGDLLYSQLLYPALHDLGVPEARRRSFLARYSPLLTDLVVARLHASAPNGHVTHLHDILGWWPGHHQRMAVGTLLRHAASDTAAALALARRGVGPHESDPRTALRRLGATPHATGLWEWPFNPDVTYLVCATTMPGPLPTGDARPRDP
jgi:hypothetical protein